MRRQSAPGLGQRLAWVAAGLAGGTALGYAVAYLTDPQRGRERREQLQRRGAELARRAADTVPVGGDDALEVTGVDEPVTPDLKDPSDAVLLERVRAEAIGPSTVPNASIVTTVEGGVVTIRGEVRDAVQRDELLTRIIAVEGVEDVLDRTHLPNEPAPTQS